VKNKKLLIGMIVGRYFASRPDGTPDENKIEEHIRLAEKYAIMLWNEGFGAFTPHLNTAHFEIKTHISETVYQEFDRRILKGVDFIFVLPNWRKSRGGALKEVKLAQQLNIPIFDSLDELKKWRKKQNYKTVTI